MKCVILAQKVGSNPKIHTKVKSPRGGSGFFFCRSEAFSNTDKKLLCNEYFKNK